MLSSKALMENLSKGVFEVDGTYRLTKNNYPWVVSGAVDKRGQFHPIAFMISNQETDDSFRSFFNGIVETATRMDDEFDPDYIMMDASDATYNAAKEVFPYATILMCYFHVMKNIRKNCQKPLSEEAYQDLLSDIRYIHIRKNLKDLDVSAKRRRRR